MCRVLAALAWLVVMAGAAVPVERATAAAPGRYYVETTGHVIGEPFLSHWASFDGWDILGMPVTEPADVAGRRTQFFEYGGLSVAAGAAAESSPFSRLPTGANLLAVDRPPGRLAAGRRVGGERQADAFRPLTRRPTKGTVTWDATTRHAIKGRFKHAYDTKGGLARFGRPLSEAYVDAGTRVQWFEYGRLQWSGAMQTVEIAATGYELAVALGVDTDARPRGSLPLFAKDRFRRYAGDGTVPEAPGAFDPVRIVIPTIGVNALIEPVLISNGVMGSPENAWNVGWYPALAKPGQRTNVVMAGHRDWWGMGPVVFWALDRLVAGDKIYLLGHDGSGATYQVAERFQTDAAEDATPLITDTGREVLTLITCGGFFNGFKYLSRTIVRAERI